MIVYNKDKQQLYIEYNAKRFFVAKVLLAMEAHRRHSIKELLIGRTESCKPVTWLKLAHIGSKKNFKVVNAFYYGLLNLLGIIENN